MSSADNFANSLDPDQARPMVWPDLETGADPGFGKGVHVYKGVGVHIPCFISFFLNIP